MLLKTERESPSKFKMVFFPSSPILLGFNWTIRRHYRHFEPLIGFCVNKLANIYEWKDEGKGEMEIFTIYDRKGPDWVGKRPLCLSRSIVFRACQRPIYTVTSLKCKTGIKGKEKSFSFSRESAMQSVT